MKSSARFALTISAVMLFAGCGARSVSSALPETASFTGAKPGATLRDASSSKDLLYVAEGQKTVIFSYPKGTRLRKTRGDYHYSLQGECADTNGDVYVINQYNPSAYVYIFEYAHGGTKPIRTLGDSDIFDESCSVDPLSGDLAVAATSGNPVTIFQSGSSKQYALPKNFSGYACSYDNRGNLFVNGWVGSYEYLRLAELRNGSQNFAEVTLRAIRTSKHGPGGIRWDGKYLAFGDGGNTIYRLAVSGRKARVAGTVHLGETSHVPDIWIQGDTIVSGDGHIWDYPAGGKPIRTIHFNWPYYPGVAVSVPPTR